MAYLVIGGYAVNHYGFHRTTGDLDIWIEMDPGNAERLARVLGEFGFGAVNPKEFLEPRKIIRMGIPPVRLAILTSISGVEFADCFERKLETEWDGVAVNVINLADLKRNKRASGRLKDRADLEQLQ